MHLITRIYEIVIGCIFCMKRIMIDRKNQNSKKVKTGLLFIPVSITPLIDTEDACFDLNASRPIAKGDLKWRDALLVAHRVNSNKTGGKRCRMNYIIN